MSGKGYVKLTIGPLTEELETAIDEFLYHINFGNGKTEDCYRSEIDFWLKDAKGKISEEQYEAVKRYYVYGGIYDELGYPWQRRRQDG